MEQANFYTIEKDHYYDDPQFGWTVFGWSIWEKGSLLAGQQKKMYRASFDTLEEAQKAFPDAGGDTGYVNTFDHLPEE